jgi:hypothetical protein
MDHQKKQSTLCLYIYFSVGVGAHIVAGDIGKTDES